MSEEQRNGSGGRIAIVVGLVIAMPVLYVLSIGPAILLHDNVPPPMQRAIEIFYVPLQWLYMNCEWFGYILDPYLELWQ